MRGSGGGDLRCAVPACCVRPRIYLSAAPSFLQRGSSGSRQPSLAAMTWYSDYDVRKDRLLRDGLPVLVRGARIDAVSGFMAIYLEADEFNLLRSNADREFDLHISLGFVSDYAAGTAEHCVNTINERWRGRLVRLKVSWIGGGGSIQLACDDPLACDDYIGWVHRRGWYGNGVNCRPRDLHVSL